MLARLLKWRVCAWVDNELNNERNNNFVFKGVKI